MTEINDKTLEEMSMAELWGEAKRLGISKEGKKEDLIARIREAKAGGASSDSNDDQDQEREVSKEVIYISRYHELKLVVDPSYLKEVGVRVLTIKGKCIQFHEGIYRTSDPEEIAFLNNHPNYGNVFRKIEQVEIKGKNLEQVYKDKFKTLEERERDIAIREESIKRKEMVSKGHQEGASSVTSGIEDTTNQPKF